MIKTVLNFLKLLMIKNIKNEYLKIIMQFEIEL